MKPLAVTSHAPITQAPQHEPPAEAAPEKTKLKTHLDFFAARSHKPGFVTVPSTYEAARDLGLSVFSSGIVGLAIPAGLAKPTTGKAWPLEVSVQNIAGGKHGGDSEIFDKNGNFVQAKFDQLWARHDPEGKGYLTEADINHMVQTNSAQKDQNRITSTLEFNLLLVIASEVNVAGEHVLTKPTLQRFYQEGFQFLADRRQEALGGKLDSELAALTLQHGGAAAGPGAAAVAAANELRVPLDGKKTVEQLARRKSVLPTLLAAAKNLGAPQASTPLPASVD